MNYKIIFENSLKIIRTMDKSYKYIQIGLNERYNIIFTNDKFRKEYFYDVEGSNMFLRGQVYQFDKDGSFRKKQNEKKKQEDNIPHYAYNCNFLF